MGIGCSHAVADAEPGSLQEITVTATRRAASAQDLPISITAVTGADLQKAGIDDLAGLAHMMSGVNYTDKGPFGGVNGATLIIRGLNSEATGGHNDSAEHAGHECDGVSRSAPVIGHCRPEVGSGAGADRQKTQE